MKNTAIVAPIIHEDIWGDEPVQEFYTVQVYKHTGMGNEATKTNVLATSQEDACKRVANSYPWLRTNPMFAIKQNGRIW